MKYSELIAYVQNRIQDDSNDAEVLNVIKNALNQSVMLDLCNYEPTVATSIIIVVNGTGNLPSDFNELITISPALAVGEQIKGLTLISADGEYNITYTAIPELIIDPNSDMPISNKLCYFASTYAAYAYYQYRKKTDIAQMFLNDYNASLNKIETTMSNYDVEIVGDSYGGDV